MKKCIKCKKLKSKIDYHKLRTSADGLYPYCKQCRKAYGDVFYRKNFVDLRKKKVWAYHKNMDSWRGFIPEKSKCECCGKEILFASGSTRSAIHFDHRNGGKEFIKSHPSRWLALHRRTPENELIWKSCNFGLLCNRCNSVLPTINRNEYVTKLMMYINISKKL